MSMTLADDSLSASRQLEGPLLPVTYRQEGLEHVLGGVVALPPSISPDEIDIAYFMSSGWVALGDSLDARAAIACPRTIARYDSNEMLPDGRIAPVNCVWIECEVFEDEDAYQLIHCVSSHYFAFASGERRGREWRPVRMKTIGIFEFMPASLGSPATG